MHARISRRTNNQRAIRHTHRPHTRSRIIPRNTTPITNKTGRTLTRSGRASEPATLRGLLLSKKRLTLRQRREVRRRLTVRPSQPTPARLRTTPHHPASGLTPHAHMKTSHQKNSHSTQHKKTSTRPHADARTKTGKEHPRQAPLTHKNSHHTRTPHTATSHTQQARTKRNAGRADQEQHPAHAPHTATTRKRLPHAPSRVTAATSALLFHAHALTLHEQRHKTLTIATTVTNVNQPSLQRPTINTPNTRQRLLSVRSLKVDTRIRANKTNRRDNTHLIALIHRRRTTNQRNLRPRALTAAHRPHTRIRPTQVTDTTQQ